MENVFLSGSKLPNAKTLVNQGILDEIAAQIIRANKEKESKIILSSPLPAEVVSVLEDKGYKVDKNTISW